MGVQADVDGGAAAVWVVVDYRATREKCRKMGFFSAWNYLLTNHTMRREAESNTEKDIAGKLE